MVEPGAFTSEEGGCWSQLWQFTSVVSRRRKKVVFQFVLLLALNCSVQQIVPLPQLTISQFTIFGFQKQNAMFSSALNGKQFLMELNCFVYM